jgi:Ca2+/Na+ antiporter
MTIVCFHISTVLYVLLGIGFLAIFATVPLDPELPRSFGPIFGVVTFVLCLVFAAGVEVVVWGLKKLKYWAWITGIVTCAFYISSIFIVLGGLGLWGLLDAETQAAFNAARSQK